MLPIVIGGIVLMILLAATKSRAGRALPEEGDKIYWDGRLWEPSELRHEIRQTVGTMDDESYVAFLADMGMDQVAAWMELLRQLDMESSREYVLAAAHAAGEEPLMDPYGPPEPEDDLGVLEVAPEVPEAVPDGDGVDLVPEPEPEVEAPPPPPPEEIRRGYEAMAAGFEGASAEEIAALLADMTDDTIRETIAIFGSWGYDDGVIAALRAELARRVMGPPEPEAPFEIAPEPEAPFEIAPEPEPLVLERPLPAGYDPERARRLAPMVAANIRNRGCAAYDRVALENFQEAAAITKDGWYGGGSRGALIYYGVANPPRPCFRPLDTKTYVPPEER